MLSHFSLTHIPPLLIASALTFGGTMPFFNAERSITEFGLPNRIAISKAAHPVMIIGSARTTALGLALFAFYFQAKLAEFDTILFILGYLGLVDSYVCWREGVRGKAVFRLLCGVVISVWGWFGMTAGY